MADANIAIAATRRISTPSWLPWVCRLTSPGPGGKNAFGRGKTPKLLAKNKRAPGGNARLSFQSDNRIARFNERARSLVRRTKSLCRRMCQKRCTRNAHESVDAPLSRKVKVRIYLDRAYSGLLSRYLLSTKGHSGLL